MRSYEASQPPIVERMPDTTSVTEHMQKDRHQSAKVRPRTAIERVPSPATQPTLNLTFASQPYHTIVAAHGADERPHLLGVRVWCVRRLPGRMGAWLAVWWPW